MIIGFSVSNFKSFNEAQQISFLASKITRHSNHVISARNRRILRSGLIYGANASGKSNLIDAISFSRNIILRGVDNTNLSRKHFRISNENYNKPGVFEYRFITNDGEYSYGIVISYNKKEIISEWLVKIEKDKETNIFSRDIDDSGVSIVDTDFLVGDIEGKDKFNFYLDDFKENISESLKKKTILCDIAERSNNKSSIFVEIKSVFEWFKNIVIIFPGSKYSGLDRELSNSKIRSFYSKVLSSFDTGIELVDSKQQEFDFDKLLKGYSQEEIQEIKNDISSKLNESPITLKFDNQLIELKCGKDGNIIFNKMLLNHGNSQDLFEYSDESDGTKRLFDLIPIFLNQDKYSVILIDEIDRSLHTKLTRKFLELFYLLSKSNSCQLIATTHDSNLLDLDLLRQDEIWFVERQSNHSSIIYSLNKFKERYDKKVEKDYLLGRYGAIPVFNSFDDLEEIVYGE